MPLYSDFENYRNLYKTSWALRLLIAIIKLQYLLNLIANALNEFLDPENIRLHTLFVSIALLVLKMFHFGVLNIHDGGHLGLGQI